MLYPSKTAVSRLFGLLRTLSLKLRQGFRTLYQSIPKHKAILDGSPGFRPPPRHPPPWGSQPSWREFNPGASGNLWQFANWKITVFLMGKSTISMAMFYSYVELPEGNPSIQNGHRVAAIAGSQGLPVSL